MARPNEIDFAARVLREQAGALGALAGAWSPTRQAAAQEVARRMAENNVGAVVVQDEAGGAPAGVITDRDIAVRCVADGLDPDQMRAEDLMSSPVRTVYEHVPIDQALARMAEASTRRLVVVGEGNAVAGMLCLDDVVSLIAGEMDSIGRILAGQSPSVDRQVALAAAPGAPR